MKIHNIIGVVILGIIFFNFFYKTFLVHIGRNDEKMVFKDKEFAIMLIGLLLGFTLLADKLQ